MGRLLAAALISALPGASQAIEITQGHEAAIGVEGGYVQTSGLSSWTEGSVGKLRYGDDGAVLSRAYLDYRGHMADTVTVRAALEAYDDDIGNAIDLTQAFLEWRPVPKSPTSYRLKLGMFYPRISLENTEPGWSSPYSLNSSAINTWVAEELRSTGAELTVSRRLATGSQMLSLHLAAYVGNDPAGSLIAWKGWSVHDRQTRLSDDLPLAPLPQLQPGGMFEANDPFVEPILELDNRVGYYVNAEWRIGSKFLVRAMHYDNRADPAVIEKGQYGWTTVFDHVGVQAVLPGDIGFFAQWMGGSTVMGPFLGAWHPVDVGYSAGYLMLTRGFGPHRVTARYDRFDVTDEDELPGDDNRENGHAWTIGYQFSVNDNLTLAGEWLGIKTRRDAWAYFDIASTATEEQLQVLFRLKF